MGSGPTVDQYHFDGWELPTKYGWMHTGAGVQAATLAQDAVREMSERLIASGGLVRDLLGGARWAGTAAIAAGEAMHYGADQITQTAAGAATADRCVTELGESFTTAQHRVPAPNEVPTGLGDQFLYGAAEGISALSPFDVQSPLHIAMQQRRELDQQANLALTDHMTASRERVEAMPAVAAPAPMTVVAQSAGPSGIGVGQPTGVVPAAPGPGGAPSVTPPAGSGGGPSPVLPAVHAGQGPVRGGAALPSGPGPDGTGPASAPTVGGVSRPGTSGPDGPAAGPGATGSVIGPPIIGSAGTGRATGGSTARGSGYGFRTDADGERRSAAGFGGPASGSALPARGPGINATSGRTPGGTGAGRPGGSSFLQPPVGGRGSGDDDGEHKDRYAQQTDHLVGELPLVAPAVLGETPEEEARRLRDGG